MRKRAPIDIVGPIDCQHIPGAGRHMHEVQVGILNRENHYAVLLRNQVLGHFKRFKASNLAWSNILKNDTLMRNFWTENKICAQFLPKCRSSKISRSCHLSGRLRWSATRIYGLLILFEALNRLKNTKTCFS